MKVDTSFTSRPRVSEEHPGGHEGQLRLTPRQLEVLSLLDEGLPNKLICRQLNISAGTVKVHISCILRELGVTSRLQAVVWARRHGLLGGPGGGRAVLDSHEPTAPALAAASETA